MPGHGQKISRKQEQAIAALLLEPTIPEAAKSIKIHERTLWRWLKNPAFKKSYQKAKFEVVSQAIAHLQKATGEAVQALREIVNNHDAPANARVNHNQYLLGKANKKLTRSSLMVKKNSKSKAHTKTDKSGLSNLKKTAIKNLPKDKNGGVLPGPGRPMGSKNKTPAKLVDKILEIEGQLELDGKGLLDCARQNPPWFYEKIMAKVLPKNIEFGTEPGPVKIQIIDSFQIPKDDDSV